MIICMKAVHAYVQACSLSSSNYVLLFSWDEDRWIRWCRTTLKCDVWISEIIYTSRTWYEKPSKSSLSTFLVICFHLHVNKIAINSWATKTDASGVIEKLTNYWTVHMKISANCYELSYHHKHLYNQSMNKAYGIQRHINSQEFWNVLNITTVRDAHKVKASRTTNTRINQLRQWWQ